MKPWKTVATARAPDGTTLTLAQRDGEWVVRVQNHVLMSSRVHGSEERLAQHALEKLAPPTAVLVGGLGLGFTLQAVLKLVPATTRVIVSELIPEVAEWNRTHLAHLHENALGDARVEVAVGNVLALLKASPAAFDAVILDVDNGPTPVAHAANSKLYTPTGVSACFQALRPGGRLTVWSAGPDLSYLQRLRAPGFDGRMLNVAASPSGGARHTIFLAERPRTTA